MKNKNMSYMIAPAELEVKDFDPDKKGSIFKGYASIFDVPDRGKDIALKGMFTKSLATKDKYDLKVLYQHQKLQPIGHVKKAGEDEKGLYIDEGWIDHTTIGRDTAIMMDSKTLNKLSFGYYEIDVDTKSKPGFQLLKEVDIWEVSPVTWSQHPSADITSIKSLIMSPEISIKGMWALHDLLYATPNAVDFVLNPDEWKAQAFDIIKRAADAFRQFSEDLYTLVGKEPAQETTSEDGFVVVDQATEEMTEAVDRLNALIGPYRSRLGFGTYCD